MAATLVEHGFDISGTTAQRPASPDLNCRFFDTTLGIHLVWNGTAWVTDLGLTGQAPANGAAAATGNVATEKQGVVHQTLLTLTAVPLTLVDANVGGGTKIYDFPEGRILVLGATGSLAFTTTSVLASTLNAGVTINWGVGTVQTTNQNSGTLATTQQDLIGTTNATASATINVAGAASNGKLAASAQFDGTTTPIDAYLNVGVATATDIDADATVTITGTILLTWINLGDY